MDFTSWCDDILLNLAEWLRQRPHGLYGHLDTFATDYLDQKGLALHLHDAVIEVVLDVFGSFGLPDDDKQIHLKHGELTILTNAYGRWEASFRLDIDETEREVIDAVNRLSIVKEEGGFVVREVDDEALWLDTAVQGLRRNVADDHLREVLDALHHHKLISQRKWVGSAQYEATYCGYTRLNRAQILMDQEINAMRLQGESDNLDYKRVLDVASKKGKADFAKDAVAFANTGGNPIKHILVGVEDDGTFPRPDEPESHRQAVHSLKDTTLQQIVNERTLHAPSVTIKAKGEHQEGPYTLIAITSHPANAPYRFFANPSDSREPGATEAGEVWVRKGTTKHRASPDEVVDLERRADLYRKTFPGRK